MYQIELFYQITSILANYLVILEEAKDYIGLFLPVWLKNVCMICQIATPEMMLMYLIMNNPDFSVKACLSLYNYWIMFIYFGDRDSKI